MIYKSLSWLHLATLTGFVFLAAAGCSGTSLPPARIPNIIDTSTFYALQSTNVPTASAYDVANGQPARLELGQSFDFAVDIAGKGQAVIIPAPVLGIPSEAGVQPTDEDFSSITRAPLEDYIKDTRITVAVNGVFLAQSRVTADFCQFVAAAPRYGKFKVIAVDMQARTVQIESLVNRNCGYRDLTEGIPEN